MKDLFSSYHRQKALSHLWILWISWILAISINVFVLWWANSEILKANITELQKSTSAQEDISIMQSEQSIKIINNVAMDTVQQFSISFAYNHELLVFWDSISGINWANISKIETNPWFSSFLVVFENPIDIEQNSDILELGYTRTSPETIHLNPVNTNFTDAEDANYSLSVSSLIF